VAPLVAGALVVAGLAAAPAYAVDAIDGPLTSGDSLFPNQGNGGYDVSHYDLAIAWTPGLPATIDATTTITATTTGPPLSSFGLDLEGLTVSSVMVDGQTAGFSHIDEATSEPPGKHKLVVTPATPVDGAFTVVVTYHGAPSTHVDTDGSSEGWVSTLDGATFLGQPIGSMTGFPNNNTPSDKATYTVTLDVPQLLEAASNGELVSADTVAGRRIWVWNQTRPMASELALVSIGQFDVHESTVALSGGRTVHEWSFIDSALSPTVKSNVDAERAQLSTILLGLEALFGPYPGHSTGIVVDAVPGVGYALETQDRPFFPGGVGHETFVHELTHQWYGDAVSPTVWNDLWINEGMATWAPVHVASESTFDEFHGEWETTPANDPRWTIPPVGITDTADLYGFQSYDRGAMTYEALRTLIGEAHFDTLVEEWQPRYDGESHGTDDLIALAEEVSGQDLTAFFQDWLRDPDKPAWPNPAQPPTQPPPTEPPTQPPPGTIGGECGVRIKGKALVGRTLTARIRGCPAGATSTYQWFAGRKRVSGATHAAYKIPASKAGKWLRAQVTVRVPGYLDAVRLSPRTKRVT
jgi:hypothetical protein